MFPRAPRSDVRRLRRLVEDASLDIRFDSGAAAISGRQAWSVFYLDGWGKDVWLLDWALPLDGNLAALAERVRRVDFRHQRPKDFSGALDERYLKQKAERRRRRRDELEDLTDYSAAAFKAAFEGKPSIGAYGAGTTGKA